MLFGSAIPTAGPQLTGRPINSTVENYRQPILSNDRKNRSLTIDASDRAHSRSYRPCHSAASRRAISMVLWFGRARGLGGAGGISTLRTMIAVPPMSMLIGDSVGWSFMRILQNPPAAREPARQGVPALCGRVVTESTRQPAALLKMLPVQLTRRFYSRLQASTSCEPLTPCILLRRCQRPC